MYALAWLTGALWAEPTERGILRETREGEK